MKAVVFGGKETILIEERPEPVPGAGEVVIRVRKAGICGTDMSIVSGLHPRAKPALVMGHEFVGAIESIGGDVHQNLSVGERVVVEPLISCGKCYACRAGFSYVCEKLGLYGIDTDGAFAELVKVAADKVFQTPESLSDTAAALIEPLAVAVHAVRESALKVGDEACVLGGGPIGLLTALVAREAGLKDIVLVERRANRIEIAKGFGIPTFDSSTGGIEAEILRRTDGRGVDVVFEAAGAPATMMVAPRLCRIRGEIIQISMPKTPREMDVVGITFREVTLKGVRCYAPFDFQRAIDLATTWAGDLERIASEPFALDDAERAFAVARQGDQALKVIFDIDG
jgi:(R,R)-butanediol dehydrogenase/meso-butanediol dehydrogenase/diacetyl reductase